MITKTSVAVLLGLLSAFSPASAAPPLEPNELGQIMVLEYHQMGPGEGRWRRTFEHFRDDLAALYARGYYLTNLNDLIDRHLDVPKGKTPVVLTFDDSAPGQFNTIRTAAGDEILDPGCAAGIITEFSRRHPDFGRAATFYMMPDAKRGNARSKLLRELVALGFEIGNHTLTHPRLDKTSRERTEHEIAGLQAWVELNVPGYRIRSMALPFGIYPKWNGVMMDSWAADGKSDGVTYHHEALLEVGSGPMPSPFSRKLKLLHIPRIQVWGDAPAGQPVFSYFLHYFDQHPEARFVSDGEAETITVPKARSGELDGQFTKTHRVILR
ncbi:MAG: polysaccharide deacetylase family protein [Deltaproteobacteria bacterium]|nr:polysaccharide deacetylase family protein [Deltaproteobacteria bacterium]